MAQNEKKGAGKWLLMIAVASVMAACGVMNLSPEEKAKREAELEIAVNQALVERHFRINVSDMITQRSGDRFHVSGSWIKVDSTQVECELPYVGLDEYDLPYVGLVDDITLMETLDERRWDSYISFSGPIEDYLHVYDVSTNTGTITFKSLYRGSDYKFTITVEHIPEVRIWVQPEDCDDIFYEGVLSH